MRSGCARRCSTLRRGASRRGPDARRRRPRDRRLPAAGVAARGRVLGRWTYALGQPERACAWTDCGTVALMISVQTCAAAFLAPFSSPLAAFSQLAMSLDFSEADRPFAA